jgi:hypothetical protein
VVFELGLLYPDPELVIIFLFLQTIIDPYSVCRKYIFKFVGLQQVGVIVFAIAVIVVKGLFLATIKVIGVRVIEFKQLI